MHEISIQNGVPGSLKTTHLISRAKQRAEMVTSGRYQTGTHQLHVQILTFTHNSKDQVRSRYISSLEKFVKHDFHFDTADSFVSRYLPPKDRPEYVGGNDKVEIAKWVAYLKSDKPITGYKSTSLDYKLVQILKGEIAWVRHAFVPLVFVDEAQDLRPRHVIALLMLQAAGLIGEIHFWGDRIQKLYGDAISLAKFEGQMGGEPLVGLEKLAVQVRLKLGLVELKVEVKDKPVINSSYRLTENYLSSCARSNIPEISLLFRGGLGYEVKGVDKEDRSASLIERNIREMTPNDFCGTLQVDVNLLKYPKGSEEQLKPWEKGSGRNFDKVKRFGQKAIEIALRTKAKLLVFHDASDNSAIEEIEKGIIGESEAAVLTHLDAHSYKPSTDLGKFLALFLRGEPSIDEGFLAFLKLYLTLLEKRFDSTFHMALLEGFSSWVRELSDLPGPVLRERLIRLSLTGITDWIELLKMHKAQDTLEELLPESRYLVVWTFYKAKGQTFSKPSAVLVDPLLEVKDKMRLPSEIKRRSEVLMQYYTALSRSRQSHYLIG